MISWTFRHVSCKVLTHEYMDVLPSACLTLFCNLNPQNAYGQMRTIFVMSLRRLQQTRPCQSGAVLYMILALWQLVLSGRVHQSGRLRSSSTILKQHSQPQKQQQNQQHQHMDTCCRPLQGLLKGPTCLLQDHCQLYLIDLSLHAHPPATMQLHLLHMALMTS